MGVGRNAAVYAGLAGTLALVAPIPAAALSLRDAAAIIDDTFATPAAAFVAGVAGGVLVMGVVAGAASLASRRRRARGGAPDGSPTARPAADGGAAVPGDAPTAASPAVAAPSRRPRPRHMRPDVALFEEDAADEPAPAPSHAASDYEDIASNYVGRASFRDRMARRAEGVAAILRERLGGNMMEGVPVIARADGSVGDVGTSWWRQAVGEQSIISDSGFAAEEPGIAIPSDFTDPHVGLAGGIPPREGIARRVANIDQGAYPVHRTVDDLNDTDEWDRALRSLDERIALESAEQGTASFCDLIGGADTLDEPDNIEPQTAFIPFKTPAGHPEVVDTETYVDYLIGDEFSKCSSLAARRSSSRFLRVLEGGTQPTSRHLSDTRAGRTGHAGKHFASAMAAEA